MPLGSIRAAFNNFFFKSGPRNLSRDIMCTSVLRYYTSFRHHNNAVQKNKFDFKDFQHPNNYDSDGHPEYSNALTENVVSRFPSFADISLSYRYAVALQRSVSSLPNSAKAFEQIKHDIESLRQAHSSETGRFKFFLESPLPKDEEKLEFYDSLESLGISKPMIRFLHLLHEHKRFNFMLKIFDAFETVCNIQNMEVSCKIETCEELSHSEKAHIQTLLTRLRPEQTLRIEYSVSANIVKPHRTRTHTRPLSHLVRKLSHLLPPRTSHRLFQDEFVMKPEFFLSQHHDAKNDSLVSPLLSTKKDRENDHVKPEHLVDSALDVAKNKLKTLSSDESKVLDIIKSQNSSNPKITRNDLLALHARLENLESIINHKLMKEQSHETQLDHSIHDLLEARDKLLSKPSS